MKYWNHEGEHQEKYDKIYKELVPDMGEADSEHGELLRTLSRYVYDMYNNGLCNIDVLRDMFQSLVDDFVKLTNKEKTFNPSDLAKQHIKDLKTLLREIKENETLSTFVDEEYCDCSDCNGDGTIEEENDEGEIEDIKCEECGGSGEVLDEYNGNVSEQEEHWDNKVGPLIEKLSEDNQGVNEICDVITLYVWEKNFAIENEVKQMKELADINDNAGISF